MNDIAVCKFCGQTFYSDGAKTKEELDEYAIQECDCAQASALRRKLEYIEKAKIQLLEVFEYNLLITPKTEKAEDIHRDIRKKVEEFLQYMVDFEIINMSVSVAGLGKITLSVNSDGEIKIKKTVSNSVERKV